jgi:hypothetical protein
MTLEQGYKEKNRRIRLPFPPLQSHDVMQQQPKWMPETQESR